MTPEGWTRKRLADVASYRAGRTPARATAAYWVDAGDGMPWVAISDMTEFGVITTTKEKITQQAFESVFGRRAVSAGTLLMSFKLTIGRVATLGVDACHNEAIIAIYPKPGVDQRFLGYFLSRVDYEALQDRQIKGNTLNQEKIDRIEIWLPPLAEQIQIADMIDLVRRAICIQDSATKVALELKQTTMQVLFTKGLRGKPQKESAYGLMPEGWKVVPIADLGTIVTGNTPPTSDKTNYVGGDIPFIAPGDIRHGTHIIRTEKSITSKGLTHSRRINSGATCFVCIGSTIGKVGYVQFTVCATNQQINSIIPRSEYHPIFVFYLMTFWAEHVRKQASPSPVPILSKGAFEQVEIVTTLDVDEQREIAVILDAIDRKIDLHRRKRSLLMDLFNSLLHKLMTGEVRVDELDFECLSPAISREATA